MTCHHCSLLLQATSTPTQTEAVISALLRLVLMTEKYLPCFEIMVTSFTIRYNSMQETLTIFFDFSNKNSKANLVFIIASSVMDLKT